MKLLTRLAGWCVVMMLLLPMMTTAWVSFSPDSFLTPPTGEWSGRWYRQFFADRRWVLAFGRSLTTAASAATLAVAVALPAVPVLARGRCRWARPVLLAPACVPAVALSMGALPVAHRLGLWDTPFALILALAACGIPAVLLVSAPAFGPELAEREEAARGLGAGRLAVARLVTWPAARPSAVAAWLVVFALALNEPVLAVFLGTPGTETVPAVAWPLLRFAPSPLVAVAAVLNVVVCGALLGLAAWLGRR